MTQTTTSDWTRASAGVSAVLFLCLFAGQAGLIATTPTLAQVAEDFDVSTAAAGQLRTIAGLAAALTAVVAGRFVGRVGLGLQLLGASSLLALGSTASAVAPGFWLLAASQVPVGMGVAGLTTAGTLAAAEWVPAQQRARVLSWALVGPPAAWIVGMPLVGVVGEKSWRYGWIVLPLVAAIAVAASVARRVGERSARHPVVRARSVLGDRQLARWLVSELCATAAWAGTLVYLGALLVDAHGASVQAAGCLLAVVAVVFAVGNLAGRRLVSLAPRPVLIVLGLVLALTDSLAWTIRPDLATSVVLLSAVAIAAGARTLVSNSLALAGPRELRSAVIGLRAATMQFGYFVGSIVGGVALTAGGYGLLGAAMAALFLAGAAALVSVGASQFGRDALGQAAVQPVSPSTTGGHWSRARPLPVVYQAHG